MKKRPYIHGGSKERVDLRCSEEFISELRERSEALGVSTSEYVRIAVFYMENHIFEKCLMCEDITELVQVHNYEIVRANDIRITVSDPTGKRFKAHFNSGVCYLYKAR